MPVAHGSFELVMSAFFVQQGVGKADAIAAAMLFRVVSFWAPLAASGLLMLAFRGWNEKLRRTVRRPARAA